MTPTILKQAFVDGFTRAMAKHQQPKTDPTLARILKKQDLPSGYSDLWYGDDLHAMEVVMDWERAKKTKVDDTAPLWEAVWNNDPQKNPVTIGQLNDALLAQLKNKQK